MSMLDGVVLRNRRSASRVPKRPAPMIVPVVMARVWTCVVRIVRASGWSSAYAGCGKYRDMIGDWWLLMKVERDL